MIGSADRCGWDACPPRPRTVTRMMSAAAQHRPRFRREHAARELGRGDVQRVRGDRPALPGGGQHALADHLVRAPVALLAGLEHEDHVSPQLGPPGAKQPRRPGQHRRMQVVAAGVHHPGEPRGVRQPRCLRDRQRVHIPAQQHRRPGYVLALSHPSVVARLAAQHRRHRGEFPAGGHLQRQATERREHLFLRQRQVQPDLRLPVDGVPQLGDLTGDRSGVLDVAPSVRPLRGRVPVVPCGALGWCLVRLVLVRLVPHRLVPGDPAGAASGWCGVRLTRRPAGASSGWCGVSGCVFCPDRTTPDSRDHSRIIPHPPGGRWSSVRAFAARET